jgi:hypothetical protein
MQTTHVVLLVLEFISHTQSNPLPLPVQTYHFVGISIKDDFCKQVTPIEGGKNVLEYREGECYRIRYFGKEKLRL